MTTEIFVADDGKSFTLGVPFVKVDKKGRTVEGFATLDNVDQAQEIVDFDASKEAFSKWIGNIREMHETKAVGKAIRIREGEYTDDDGITYKGMWVKARISKGAEDTWEKVLDGTLCGFSIGGGIQERKREMVKTADGSMEVSRITKYRLTELSLVDNPCNQLALVSLAKSIDGGKMQVDDVVDDIAKAYDMDGNHIDMSGELSGVVTALEAWRDKAIEIESDHTVARVSEILADIRWSCKYECMEAEEVTNTKKDDSATSSEENMEKQVLHENAENGTTSIETLSDEEVSVFRKFIDYVTKREAPVETPVVETEVETTEEGDEEMNTEEVTKAIDTVKEELSKSADEKFEQVGTSLEKIATLLEGVATKEATDAIAADVTEKFDTLAARIEALETSGAAKKSAEDAGAAGEETVEKSNGFWAGSLVPEYMAKG